MKVSYVEIYKEELRDLLELNADNKQDLHVREDDKGNTGKIFTLQTRFLISLNYMCIFYAYQKILYYCKDCLDVE